MVQLLRRALKYGKICAERLPERRARAISGCILYLGDPVGQALTSQATRQVALTVPGSSSKRHKGVSPGTAGTQRCNLELAAKALADSSFCASAPLSYSYLIRIIFFCSTSLFIFNLQ